MIGSREAHTVTTVKIFGARARSEEMATRVCAAPRSRRLRNLLLAQSQHGTRECTRLICDLRLPMHGCARARACHGCYVPHSRRFRLDGRPLGRIRANRTQLMRSQQAVASGASCARTYIARLLSHLLSPMAILCHGSARSICGCASHHITSHVTCDLTCVARTHERLESSTDGECAMSCGHQPEAHMTDTYGHVHMYVDLYTCTCTCDF